jgi:hypothetical protein
MARKDPRIEAAEDELIDCMRILRRMPDRERSWLLHSTLRWPAMVRDQGDYPEQEEPCRAGGGGAGSGAGGCCGRDEGQG